MFLKYHSGYNLCYIIKEEKNHEIYPNGYHVNPKKMDQIPYELIAELCQKITVDMWVEKYESSRKK